MFALLRKWTNRKQSPTRQYSFRRTLLGVEQMEDRTVPSTVVSSNTYNWSGLFGSATVTVTVTEDAPGYEDQYLWNYHVTNNSSFNEIEEFEVPVRDPDEYGLEGIRLVVGNFGSSLTGWESEVGNSPYGYVPFSNQDHRVWWYMDAGSAIGVGQSADFWFTTVPTSITSGTGVLSPANGGFAVLASGAVDAPRAPNPLEVTTTIDAVPKDARVSLREAVDYVNGLTKHPTKLPHVTFPGLSGSTITLDPAKGQLTLENDIFIDGQVGGITIQRNSGATQKHRIFELKSGYWAKLANLTLRNGLVDSGNGGAGGAILSNSQLIIENCTFSQNEATGTRGGAIAAITPTGSVMGMLDITGSGFTGNSSQLGGAIYIDERVSTSISSSSFILNTATGSGGGIYIYGSTNATPTWVTLTGVDVNGNTAQDAGGGIYARNGGSAGTTLKLTGGTTVRNNQVLHGSGKGGGVYFGKGTLTLDATGGAVSISSNTAATGPSIYRVNVGTTLTIVGAGNTYVDDTGP